MANIKELIQSIEAADSSFDEKLNAINQMEETLVAMRQQEQEAIDDNVDLIVEAINVMQKKVDAQLVEIQGIIPEKGDKGDKGADGKQGKDGRDGKDGKDGLNGKDGVDGKDGVSVTDAKIDFDGSLVISLSTGQEINVGEVVAPELQERIKLVTSGGAGTVLPTQTGNANKYLKTDGSALSWDALNGSDIDLSTPPTIGNTTPNTVTATTLIGGGGSANYGQLTGGATTKAVEFQTLGSDSNIALVLDTKGTGAIDLAAGSSGVNISNGGTVTAITRTNSGGANYTTVPSVTVSAPTTVSGVQATASATMFVGSATVSAGGSGYAVGNVLTIVGGTNSSVATLTVATLSGSAVATVTITTIGSYTALPSNPVSVTGGAGTGATFTLAWSVSTIVVDTAGSGYVEQPTVTFSSGSATAYATVGSGTRIQSLGSTMSFYSPNGETFRVSDNGTSSGAFWVAFSGSTQSELRSANASGGAAIANGGAFPLLFRTNISAEQMRVSHTASAVNYVQVTGGATGSFPIISPQGSDGNISLQIYAKGTGAVNFWTSNGGSRQFQVTHTAGTVVNYATVTGNIAGASPAFAVAGTDTDIDLTLTPKGAGAVRFGTYTASVLTPTGYITIKDSGGTSRRLLVG
jgi:hypothetical protein